VRQYFDSISRVMRARWKSAKDAISAFCLARASSYCSSVLLISPSSSDESEGVWARLGESDPCLSPCIQFNIGDRDAADRVPFSRSAPFLSVELPLVRLIPLLFLSFVQARYVCLQPVRMVYTSKYKQAHASQLSTRFPLHGHPVFCAAPLPGGLGSICPAAVAVRLVGRR